MTTSITCPVCERTSYHPKDVETGYCGRCHEFTGDPAAVAQANRATVQAIERALVGVDLPPLVKGDTVPAEVRTMLLTMPDLSLRRGPIFCGENGEPIHDDPVTAMRATTAIREAPGGEIEDTITSQKGVQVRVSTAYLGIDLSTLGPLPLAWETLILVGNGLPHILEPVRYMTRAAAHAGHEKIVARVRSAVG